MSLRGVLGLAVLVFLGTLVARLPARLIAPLLPAGIVCEAARGTIWQGACGLLREGAIGLEGVNWTLHPLALLHLRLSADVASNDPRVSGRAQVQMWPGTVAIDALSARLALRGGLTQLPAGLQGTLQLRISAARIQHGQLTALEGTAQVLELRSDNLGDLGSFEAVFASASPEGAIQGQVRDLAGPLALSAQLSMLPGGGYQLAGTVAARSPVNSNLAQALQLLGPPDEQGRRMFSLAGTL